MRSSRHLLLRELLGLHKQIYITILSVGFLYSICQAHCVFTTVGAFLAEAVWRNRVFRDKKRLYAWEVAAGEMLSIPMRVPNRPHGRTYTIPRSSVSSCIFDAVPDMRLQSTAAYFMRRLCESDYRLLQQTMLHLDKSIIRVGTTCSGSDLCLNVVRETFSCLSQHFQVPWC